MTNGGNTIIDDEDLEKVIKYKWQKSSSGYATTCIKNGNTMLMHRLVLNVPKEKWTHHVNENKLDNRRVNLRICSPKQNHAARGITRHNTSGYKGVCWDKNRNKWMAYISIDNKFKQLGRHDNIIDAAKAYDKKAIEVHGEFAKVNNV